MIAAAAVCPCPPLLAAVLTGQADVLPELREASAAAVSALLRAEADLVAVVGPDERTADWPADGRLDVGAYGPALARGSARPAVPLPLSLGVGALLLDQAGYHGPRVLHGIAESAPPSECADLGRRLAAAAPRVALLAMGDGSARRSISAPGYLDERAAPFDEAVATAVRDGDMPALAALDPALATDLMAVGRPAWQALAGAFGDKHPETEVRYSDAPFGVAYLVATLSPSAEAQLT